MDLRSKLNFISCNKFLSYTYSHLIRINNTRYLTNDDISRKYFNNCTSYYLNLELKQYPKHLKKIIFLSTFTESIDDIIPNCITHLTLGNEFNQPINNIPKSITHLTFGENFNQAINNLPKSITHLTFGNQLKVSKNSSSSPI